MPTQSFSLVTNLLNVARPDLFLFMVSSLVLSGESTWDMTNRICDRYFSVKAANHEYSVKNWVTPSASGGSAAHHGGGESYDL
jgi:hypothetical protein